MDLTPVSSSITLIPFAPCTAMQLRAEQKRVQAVVREALMKAEEACRALAAQNASLQCEIVVLTGKLVAVESLHQATLRAHTIEVECYKSRVEELRGQLEAEKAGKKTAAETIMKIIRALPPPISLTGFLYRQGKVLEDILKFLEGYLDASLPYS